ncbi:hypothetical protein BDN67DRAFT_917271 [Paxillus ammoniavirescens]|nr:hypothetical protein BDN67DRAFT_917271 [Paxillus ammoniavirescens]
MEGREVLFNRISGRHMDSQDPRFSYAGLFTAGSFTSSGYIYLCQLNLQIRLFPGDFVLVRSRVLEHEIEQWYGSQHISILHFMHTSLWRDCGLDHLVNL